MQYEKELVGNKNIEHDSDSSNRPNEQSTIARMKRCVYLLLNLLLIELMLMLKHVILPLAKRLYVRLILLLSLCLLVLTFCSSRMYSHLGNHHGCHTFARNLAPRRSYTFGAIQLCHPSEREMYLLSWERLQFKKRRMVRTSLLQIQAKEARRTSVGAQNSSTSRRRPSPTQGGVSIWDSRSSPR